MKKAPTFLGLLTLLAASACGSSYAESNRSPVASASSYSDAERSSSRPVAPWSDPGPVVDSPYRVELLHGDAGHLPTYYASGRAYVLGTIGERYRIRVANPTSRRVEAVVSVDGLDAIDGRPASFEDKRGYVIPAYGEVTIDGFRTSLDQVATFRFSSVRDSYAARKGEARNVGVIGVAFFPERERPVVMPRPRPYYDDRARSSAPKGTYDEEGSMGRGPGSPPPAPSAAAESRAADGAGSSGGAPRKEARRGLGTEFGEQRYSSVGYTSFQRENAIYPSSVTELRYNDRQGLLALGIPVDEAYGRDDVSLRESADPFPRSRFATPPR